MQPTLQRSKRTDYLAGALIAVLGALVSLQSLSYPRGTLSQMGPGFFPLSLGILLICTGIAIAATAKPQVPEAGEHAGDEPQWRGWLCILGGIVAFIILGNHGGLVPATFAIVFISALGDRRNTWKSALVLALATVLFAIVVFWWGLKVQLPLFRWVN